MTFTLGRPMEGFLPSATTCSIDLDANEERVPDLEVSMGPTKDFESSCGRSTASMPGQTDNLNLLAMDLSSFTSKLNRRITDLERAKGALRKLGRVFVACTICNAAGS